MDVKFPEYMRGMDDDNDNAVDREREVAITCSIFRRFHNIRLARRVRDVAPFCPISDPRRLISLTETFSFGWSSPSLSRIAGHRRLFRLTLPIDRKTHRGGRKGELNQCRTFILAGNRWLSTDHRGHIKISDPPRRPRRHFYHCVFAFPAARK